MTTRNLLFSAVVGPLLTVLSIALGVIDQGFDSVAMPEGLITLPLYSGVISVAVFVLVALVVGRATSLLSRYLTERSTRVLGRALMAVVLAGVFFAVFWTSRNLPMLCVLTVLAAALTLVLTPRETKQSPEFMAPQSQAS